PQSPILRTTTIFLVEDHLDFPAVNAPSTGRSGPMAFGLVDDLGRCPERIDVRLEDLGPCGFGACDGSLGFGHLYWVADPFGALFVRGGAVDPCTEAIVHPALCVRELGLSSHVTTWNSQPSSVFSQRNVLPRWTSSEARFS